MSFFYMRGALYILHLRKVDELVDDSARDEVERACSSFVEVVSDQGVDSYAQVVLHKHLLRRLRYYP